MPNSTLGSCKSNRALTFAIAIVAFACAIAISAQSASAATTYTQISSGTGFSCGVTAAGDVECWGANKLGQLGDGTTTSRSVPTDVHIGKATAVSAGRSTACAIVSGAAVCWGQGNSGQLGNGTQIAIGQPATVTGMASGVTAISVGGDTACAVVNGAAKCWGNGYLGDGNGPQLATTPVQVSGLTTGVSRIAVGQSQTACAIDAAELVRCWGPAAHGEMGNGTDFGTGNSAQLAPATTLNVANATAVDVGVNYVCAIAGAAVSCWGEGNLGQLGNGFVTQSNLPVTPIGLTTGAAAIATGNDHACAVIAGQVDCWGRNNRRQIGNASVQAVTNTPVTAGTLTSGVTAISAGEDSSCAQHAAQLKCWGGNGSGQLGVGTAGSSATPVAVVGTNTGATDIATSDGHSCAIVAGAVKCWGQNFNGQLGNGTFIGSAVPVDVVGLPGPATSVASGWGFSCAVVAGAAYCWGASLNGALGTGTLVQPAPTQVTGLTAGVTKIVASSLSACAIVSGGAQCWGGNAFGQLGDGSNTGSLVPMQVAGLTSGVTDIAIANDHACAVVTGAAYCWGNNSDGALGNGTLTSTNTPVAIAALGSGVTGVGTGYSFSCFLATGAVSCSGSNIYGQLATGNFAPSSTFQPALGLTSGVTQLSSGDQSSCALGSFGARCWGNNARGESGSGLPNILLETPADVAPALIGASKIAAGKGHACAIVTAGIQCWGDGAEGEIGNGEAYTPVPQSALDPTDTFGPNLTVVATFAGGDTVITQAQSLTLAATDNKGTIARLQCKLNAAAFANCGPTWNVTLTEGANTLVVEAEDNSGNVTTRTLLVTLDTTQPVITILGTSSPHIVSAAAAAVLFNVTDGAQALASIECKLDEGAYVDCADLQHDVTLTEGAHVITIKAVDLAGIAAIATYAITRDSAAPVLTFDANDLYTTIHPAFTFGATDATAVTFTCQVIGVTGIDACVSPWTASDALPDGLRSMTVRATDAAGNVSEKTEQFTIDTIAPPVTITAPRNGAKIASNTPITAFTVGNADGDLATVTCRIDAATPAACTSPYTAATLLDGPHSFTVTATDTRGNANTLTDTFIVDTKAPPVAISAPLEGGYVTSLAPQFVFAVNNTDADLATTTCRIDTAAPVDCASPYLPGTIANGPHSFTVRTTDNVGNTISDDVSFIVDTTPPTVSITSPTSVLPITDSTPTITYTFVAPDVASQTCQIGTGAIVACTSPYTVPAPLSDGAHTIKVVVTDIAGNATTATRVITVDATAPGLSITSPAEGSLTNDHTPTITFAISNPDGDFASVFCTVDALPPAACTSPFTTEPLADGVHNIAVTVYDTLGNTRTLTRQFTVTSTPVIPPVIPPETPPVVTPSALPLAPAAPAPPSLGKFPGTAKYGKQIKGPVSCEAGCTLQLQLTLGKKKLKLKSLPVAAGATSVTITFSKSVRKKIGVVLKKSQKAQLTITPVGAADVGLPKTIKLK